MDTRGWVLGLAVALSACGAEYDPWGWGIADDPNTPPPVPRDLTCAPPKELAAAAPVLASRTGQNGISWHQACLGPITVVPDRAPPPISGGTLLATRDGLLVAADPDRDMLHFVSREVGHEVTSRGLALGDEPGRLVEDASGQLHVVLRGAGAIASFDRTGMNIVRRPVCDQPRGIAYDAGEDVLHVACAEGNLVTLTAAASGGIVRRLSLGGDLRDVVVRGDRLFVSRFRSAELLELAADGSLLALRRPPSARITESDHERGEGSFETVASPSVAWRLIDMPGHGLIMLHQRSRASEIKNVAGAYGTPGGCAWNVVESVVSTGFEKGDIASLKLDATLAVDIAVSPDGFSLTTVAPGQWKTGRSQVWAADALGIDDWTSTSEGCAGVPGSELPDVAGQVVAVTYTDAGLLALQLREPAAIALLSVDLFSSVEYIDLKQPSRFDTGHALFHASTGAGVACASCHPEGGDDGHVWNVEGIGPRRTPRLRGGVMETVPFHASGELPDMSALIDDTLVRRMFAPQPSLTQKLALAAFIERQPVWKLTPADPAAAARGQQLFESDAVGCSGCHAGNALTNNRSVDVGTGGIFQVPSLRNVALHTPLMHDGCAATLRDRFTDPCAGGELHGHTAHLSPAELDDLIGYLQIL